MPSTTNLNLYLPTRNDTVNVLRDLSDNFQKIDDAFTPVRLTSIEVGDGMPTGTIITSNMSYRIGKLVVINVRMSVANGTTLANKTVFSGLPIPANPDELTGNSGITYFATNKTGVVLYLNPAGSVRGSSTSETSTTLITISGTYIAAE